MGLEPPIVEDARTNLVVNYWFGSSWIAEYTMLLFARMLAGETATGSDGLRWSADRAPCRLWGRCGLEMPSHFSTCPPDLQDPPPIAPAPMSLVRRRWAHGPAKQPSWHPPPPKPPVPNPACGGRGRTASADCFGIQDPGPMLLLCSTVPDRPTYLTSISTPCSQTRSSY